MMLIPSFGAYSLADDNITLLKPTFSLNNGLSLAALLIDVSLQLEGKSESTGWPTIPGAVSST